MNVTDIDTGAIEGEPRPFIVRHAQVPVKGIRGRVIRNPNYGGPGVSIHGWVWRPEISQHRKPMFRAALEKSIKSAGMRNPIIIYSLEEGDFLSFGGSRLAAAIVIKMKTVPAIVNDYCGRYEDSPEVTLDNYKEFFTDIPEYFEITDMGADTHYSLERNRRDTYDPAGMRWAEGEDFVATEFSWIKG